VRIGVLLVSEINSDLTNAPGALGLTGALPN